MRIQKLTALFLVILASVCLHSQEKKVELSQGSIDDGDWGREFFVAIPPAISTSSPQALEIYVLSKKDTWVELSGSDLATRRVNVKAGEQVIFSDEKELNWGIEVREAQLPVKKAIRIASHEPVAIYVVSSRKSNTEGYLAKPVANWGREYIPLSLYDNYNSSNDCAGGFLVIASQPTIVNIQLRGQGAQVATTTSGSKPGDQITASLDSGEVFMVRGDGKTIGQFDLSGSLITSSQPIGVIAMNIRTSVPPTLIDRNVVSRNPLYEMILPVQGMGVRFSCLEFRRARKGNGRGDYFRLVSKEADTKWSCSCYNRQTGALIGQNGGVLLKAGDVADVSNAAEPTALTEGFSVWESSKPVSLMQYSCSGIWSGADFSASADPFMIGILPDTLFGVSSMFSTFRSQEFSVQYLNLIVKPDARDSNVLENLKSLTLDGIPIWKHPKAETPALLSSRMANGLYCASFQFSPENKVHVIRSNGLVSFAGYLYGYSENDGFGWPISLSNVVTSVDTMPPIIKRTVVAGECGTYRCSATELRNNPNPPRTRLMEGDQIETGIASIDTVPDMRSTNYTLVKKTSQSFPTDSTLKTFDYEWRVRNTNNPARVIYRVADFAGNGAIDTLTYTPPKTVDTTAPRLQRLAKSSYVWEYTAVERAFIPNPPRACPLAGDQVDVGVASIAATAKNMRLVADITKYPADSVVRSATFSIALEDSTRDGESIVTVADRNGNIQRDTIRYVAPTSVSNQHDPHSCSWSSAYSNGRMRLEATDSDGLRGNLVVRDLSGRTFETAQVSGPSWVSETLYAPGIYFVTIEDAGLLCSMKLVVLY